MGALSSRRADGGASEGVENWPAGHLLDRTALLGCRGGQGVGKERSFRGGRVEGRHDRKIVWHFRADGSSCRRGAGVSGQCHATPRMRPPGRRGREKDVIPWLVVVIGHRGPGGGVA